MSGSRYQVYLKKQALHIEVQGLSIPTAVEHFDAWSYLIAQQDQRRNTAHRYRRLFCGDGVIVHPTPDRDIGGSTCMANKWEGDEIINDCGSARAQAASAGRGLKLDTARQIEL